MAYAFERDDLRQELRLSAAGTIYFWPKVPGTGNVAVTGSPTYTVHNPDGTQIESGTATATDVGGVDRIDCAVASIATLDEDYQVRISWAYSGANYFDIVSFDVVRWPYPDYTITLNDLQEERPDVGDTLTRLGARMNSQTSEQLASIFGYRARVELDAMVREQIEQDKTAFGKDFESAGVARETYSRPTLIINRERLNRVERKLALKLIYAADATNPEDGDDESAALYRFYKNEVATTWRGMGPLKYDVGEDMVPDKTIHQATRSITLRRVQG